MRNAPPLVTASALTTAIAAVLLFTGCSEPSANSAPDAIIVLAGVTANQPQAQLPIEVQPIIEAAVRVGAPVTVVPVDGTPEVSFRAANYEINTKNSVAEQNDVDKVQNALLAAVQNATADSNGSDLNAALSIAGDQAIADGATDPAIIVVDSGLSDSGYLDLTTPGITEAEPADVVNFAIEHDQLPTLPAGAMVYLSGIGYGAGSQAQLTPEQRENVTAIWQGLIETTGATVEVIPTPRTGDVPATSYTAGLVEPAAVTQFKVVQTGTTLEANIDADALFDGDSWHLSDEATSLLDELVTLLMRTEGAITVEGFTDIGQTSASCDLQCLSEYLERLSQHRADAVKTYLIKHGIAETRITARGMGRGDATEASPKNRRVTVVIETPQP